MRLAHRQPGVSSRPPAQLRNDVPVAAAAVGDPESWFRYLKERCIWGHEFETLGQAREVIAAYIDHYHHRPHSGLDYRTPPEVRQTWDDTQHTLQIAAA